MDSRLKLTISEDKIEPRALEQIYGALRFPFLKKLAIMPLIDTGQMLQSVTYAVNGGMK
jgi:hypothetical protein